MHCLSHCSLFIWVESFDLLLPKRTGVAFSPRFTGQFSLNVTSLGYFLSVELLLLLLDARAGQTRSTVITASKTLRRGILSETTTITSLNKMPAGNYTFYIFTAIKQAGNQKKIKKKREKSETRQVNHRCPIMLVECLNNTLECLIRRTRRGGKCHAIDQPAPNSGTASKYLVF